MTQPLHSCMTKAIIADSDQLETGPQWITARRAMLRLYDNHLTCGDWEIQYVDRRDAVLAWILHAINNDQPLGVSPGLWMPRETRANAGLLSI